MSQNDVFIFDVLNYTHNELKVLLEKLDNGHLLSPEQYDQLINDIGLNNISTFTGDYDELFNKPVIPVRLSELYNDIGYDTIKSVDYKLNNFKIDINDKLNQYDIVITALSKLDLETVSEDLAYVQKRLDYLSKLVEELRDYNNSFSNNLSNAFSIINQLQNDINSIEIEQDNFKKDLEVTNESINVINETKKQLIETTDYLKDKLVGDNNYYFEKSIVEILQEVRGEDFSDDTISLDGVTEILKSLVGTGNGLDEETFGVLMQKINGLPELICVRDYINKIDDIYEQLGKDGLIAFINQFKDTLELLDKDNKKLKEENEQLKNDLTRLEKFHIDEITVIRKTLNDYAIAIKDLENAIRDNSVAGATAMAQQALVKANDAYKFANENLSKINTLTNKVNSNYENLDSRLQFLEKQPEHVYVTELEYYRNYSEEERNSKDKLFIVTDFVDQDLDWNIERFLTKDLVANNSAMEFVTQSQYDALMNSQQINNNVIYVITDNTNNPTDVYTSIDTSSVQLAMKNSITEVNNTSIFVDVDNQLKFKDCDGYIYTINVTKDN